MIDYEKYLGIPFVEGGRSRDGLDCWGLVRAFYNIEYNVKLPSLTEEASKKAEFAEIDNHLDIVEMFTQVPVPREGDLILFKVEKYFHIGVFVHPGKMLHTLSGQMSSFENYKSIAWKRRIRGFWRYTND